MGFYRYRNIWQPNLREPLKIRIDPKNKEDKYAMIVIDKGSCAIWHSLQLTEGVLVREKKNRYK